MARRWVLTLYTLLALLCICQVSSKSVFRSHKVKAASTKISSNHKITSTFCKKFVSECIDVALAGKTGNVQVVHQCQRNGGKSSKSYTFGCKADKVEKTAKVLKQLASTGDADAVVIVSASQKMQTSTLTEVVDTATFTVATDIVATTALFGNEDTESIQVVVFPIASKRSNKVVASRFCSAFTSGCKSQCASVKSKSKNVLCRSTSVNNYSLNCQCANGKVETQHALYSAANQANKQVSKISTRTSYATAAPRTTKLVTEKVTTTVAVTASSTTQIILAATGAVQMRSSNESSLGYLYTPDDDSQLYAITDDKTEAINFMAILDINSGLYQLQLTDGSGQVFIAEAGNSGDDYEASTFAYSWTYSGDPSICGYAAFSGGRPDGSGTYTSNPCETFVFGKDIDAETISGRETANLTMQWFNPNDFFPNQYSWILVDDYGVLLSAASPDDFARAYLPSQEVSLRFPA